MSAAAALLVHDTRQALLESAAKKKAAGSNASDDDHDSDADAKPAAKKSKIEKLFSRQNQVRTVAVETSSNVSIASAKALFVTPARTSCRSTTQR